MISMRINFCMAVSLLLFELQGSKLEPVHLLVEKFDFVNFISLKVRTGIEDSRSDSEFGTLSTFLGLKSIGNYTIL